MVIPWPAPPAFFPLLRLLVPFLLFWLMLAASGWAYTFQNTGLYQSYNNLSAWANTLQSQNPNLVRVVQYGTSYQGNPLLAVNITVDPAADNPNKPEFLFAGGIHAREVIGSEAALKIAENLVNGYRNGDPLYQNMLSTRDVWIIPQQNPDGRLAVEAGRSDHRKNMHLYPGQIANHVTCGVDLNRNYPHLWNLASDYVPHETYRGPSVLSEPEAYSLWNLLHDQSKFSNLLASVDFHSGATTILTPWSSPTDYAQHQNQIPLAVRNKFASLAAALQQKTGFPTDRLTYDYYGTESDSLFEEFDSYSMTIELYNGGNPLYNVDDYFQYFNPVDAAARDATVKKAVDSALYLLSDAAFAVPEPATLVLLAAAGLILLALVRRRRNP